MKTLVLAAQDLRALVESEGLDALLERVVQRLRFGLEEAGAGRFEALPRSGFCDEAPVTGLLEWMPGRDREKTTVKLVGYHPDNPAQATPTILSIAASFENATGHAIALTDATFLTALRTGAASAVATDVLAVPEAETLGLIGCGAQAVCQLHAISKVRPIRRVLLFDIDGSVAESYGERVEPLGLPVALERVSAERVAAESDVLVTCTSVAPGAGPVFAGEQVRPWLHVNAVGSDFPGKTELPLDLLRRAFVCADYRPQCLAEGECQRIEADEIGCDLAELWCGAESYETRRRELTVFDSTGWALEDHFAMQVLTEECSRLGLGSLMEIEAVSNDPYNPYGFLGLAPKKRGTSSRYAEAIR